MIRKFKDFIENTFTENSNKFSSHDEKSTLLAAISLMIEIISVDNEKHEDEVKVLKALLRTQLQLSESEIEQFIRDAERSQQDATDFYHFTSDINTNYTQDQKIELIENLWQLAWADRSLEDIEIHVIRKLAKLLHVSHKDFIATKLKVTGQ